jgi:hypothetical protein
LLNKYSGLVDVKLNVFEKLGDTPILRDDHYWLYDAGRDSFTKNSRFAELSTMILKCNKLNEPTPPRNVPGPLTFTIFALTIVGIALRRKQWIFSN